MKVTLSGLATLSILLVITVVHAGILRVPADYSRLQAALDVAVDGDEVVVAPGTYFESASVPAVAVTLRSESGDPYNTVIDGSTNPAGVPLVFFEGDPAGTRAIRGFTLTNSADPAVDIDFTNETGHVVVEDCRFVDNGPHTSLRAAGASVSVLNNEFVDNRGYAFGGAATFHGSAQIMGNVFRNNDAIPFETLTLTQGGAIYFVNLVGREGSVVDIIDNTFESNHCTDYGGAVHLGSFQATTVMNNVFRDNVAGVCAGGIYVANALDYLVTIEHNLFADNESPLGGGIGIDASIGTQVRYNTIVGSKVGEGILIDNASEIVVVGNVVAFGDQWGIRWPGSQVTLGCNDVFGNVAGNMPGGVTGTNFSLNPYFCDRAAGDFSVAANSPCLPANNDCGVLIGAFGAGCKAVAAERKTWGWLKSRYGGRD